MRGVRVLFGYKQLISMLQKRLNLTSFYLFEFEQNVRNTACLYILDIQPGEQT